MRGLLLVVLSCTILSCAAQHGVIRDRIHGETGGRIEPLPFANVLAYASGELIAGTTSDFDGYFQLDLSGRTDLPDRIHLVFTSIGYRQLTAVYDLSIGSVESNIALDQDPKPPSAPKQKKLFDRLVRIFE